MSVNENEAKTDDITSASDWDQLKKKYYDHIYDFNRKWFYSIISIITFVSISKKESFLQNS